MKWGMTLEMGKELDKRCVWVWLNEVYRDPTAAFNTHSDEQLQELAYDALILLREHAKELTSSPEVICDNVAIPEVYHNQYDPADDVVACTSCLICGEDIPLRRYESGPRVCRECKEAILSSRKRSK